MPAKRHLLDWVQRERIVQLYVARMKTGEIAAILGCSGQTVRRVVKESGQWRTVVDPIYMDTPRQIAGCLSCKKRECDNCLETLKTKRGLKDA